MNYQEYLLNRGISIEESLKLSGDDTHVHYPLDVICNGQYYKGWSIRNTQEKKFRLKLPDGDKKLYYFGLLNSISSNSVFVTEGIEDALILRHVTPNSIAILGLAFNRLKFLCMLFDKVFWVLDQDTRGREFATSAINRLDDELKCKLFIIVIPYKDVNDYWKADPDSFKRQFQGLIRGRTGFDGQ